MTDKEKLDAIRSLMENKLEWLNDRLAMSWEVELPLTVRHHFMSKKVALLTVLNYMEEINA